MLPRRDRRDNKSDTTGILRRIIEEENKRSMLGRTRHSSA